jgi:hypothetical protein
MAGEHQRSYKPSFFCKKKKEREKKKASELVLASMKQTLNRPKLTDPHNYEHYSLFP